MNKIIISIFIISVFAMGKSIAQVAVNTDGSSPDASAMLEVTSSNKGFLPPRVSKVSDISSPAAGLMVFDQDYNCLRYYDGSFWSYCMGEEIPANTVITATGKIWMDRNLGASQVATSSTDANAYGDIYQWGRAAEGHESRSSSVYSSGLASTAQPNQGNAWDGKFIKSPNSPYDWLSPQDNTLWQGVNGTNNPCPSGFRLPTNTEWDAERQSWSSNNAAGAYASPLKLTVGGYRYYTSTNQFMDVGTSGFYWSSTTYNGKSYYLAIKSNTSYVTYQIRAYGFSVRCIYE